VTASFIMLRHVGGESVGRGVPRVAHQLMNGNLQGNASFVLKEGFAVYFSSIEVDSKSASGKIGRRYVSCSNGDDEDRDLFQGAAEFLRLTTKARTIALRFLRRVGNVMHYLYDNSLFPKVAVLF